MDIKRLASAIDIGLILAEASGTAGDIKYHKTLVDSQEGTIDVYCTKIVPLKSVKVSLKIGRAREVPEV